MVTLGIATIALAVMGVTAVLFRKLPDPTMLLESRSPESTKILDRHGELLYEVLDPRAGRRTRIRLGDLPPHLPAAIVVVEDASFWRHGGFDSRALIRATWQLMRTGRIVSGASTIPMQLAGEVLLAGDGVAQRSFLRKAREIVLAARMVRQFERATILEMYLNEVYFGQLAYGVEAAAQVYFGKPAGALDLAESAMLAGLIQSPAVTNPLVDRDAARARQERVLRLMERRGLIDADERRLAEAETLVLAGSNVPMAAPHFTAYVLTLLERQLGKERVSHGGLRVVTTLDLGLQRRAESVVERRMNELRRRAPNRPDFNATNAALVALHPVTGEILAMVGSADYNDRAIDGAVNITLAARQPGSALKPVIYAAAFDVDRWGTRRADESLSGRPPLPFTPATVLSDVATSFTTREGEPYRPINYDRTWHGPISLRRALATSSNMVAVKVLERVGLDAALDTAAALGITTLNNRDRYGLALALGGGEVRLLELTAAYAGIGNGGQRVGSHAILGVLDAAEWGEIDERLGSWVDERRPGPGPRVLSATAAYLVTDILADHTARLPAFGEGGPLAMTRPAAAKTGTTTDFRDNWTIGYTPDLAVGVWVGNADNSPMRFVTGITGAAPIWRSFMDEAHRKYPARQFAKPEGLRQVAICVSSGLLASPDCPRRRGETFVAGTEPRVEDDVHVTLALDAATGNRWADGCRGPRLVRRWRLLPPEATTWGATAGVLAPPQRDCHGRSVAASADVMPGASAVESRMRGTPDNHGPSEGIVVVNPAPGTSFAMTPLIPQSVQRTILEARIGQTMADGVLQFELNGDVVARRTAPPWRADWTLEPGAHELRAIFTSTDGNHSMSEPIAFTVVDAEAVR